MSNVENLAARGLTISQIAKAIGIGESTLYRKKREFWQFREAIEKGRAIGIAAVASKLFENAMAGNVTAIIFYLKACGLARDRRRRGLR